MYEFLDSRLGRELIFQNYAYTRFCKSNVYNCSSKTPKICYAQVMLVHNKLIILSSYHNHPPPSLLRDNNGILVPKFDFKPKPKIKRRVKPTLGPIATRKEVDSMVASIMSTVKAMENKGDTAANNTGKETTKAETRPILLKDVTPEIIETRPSVTKNKRMTDITNTGGASAVTSNENNDQALLLLRSPKPFEEDIPKNNPLGEKPDLSLINPHEEHSVQREIDRAPLLKIDAGSLIPNQMYVILPESEAGLAHNRFVLPTNNAGGLVNSNRILVSPIKSEPSTVVTGNNQTVQPENIKTGTVSSDVVTKKIDGNTVVPNKMLLCVQTNNLSSIKPKMNESGSFFPTNVEAMASNDNDTASTNAQLTQHANVPIKLETDLEVSSDMKSIAAKKTEIIPFNACDMTNKSYTSQETQTKISKAEIGRMLNIVLKKIEHDSVDPSKMILSNDMQPVKEISDFLASYMKVLSQIDISEEVMHKQTTKKSDTITVEPNKVLTIKTETDSTTSDIIQPIAPEQIVFENAESIAKKTEAVDYLASSKPSSKETDMDWIVPRRQTSKKTQAHLLSSMNTNQEATDIDITETSVMPEEGIPVSMIPLPPDNSGSSVTRVDEAANAGALTAELVPLVMIERLPMKHKAGSSDLRSVPPKKRYYQF